MGSGFKDFAAGDILTAADVDGYLMRQTVMTFADASARDTALSGVLDEGMMAYLEDVNKVTFYDGSAWKFQGGVLQVVQGSLNTGVANNTFNEVDTGLSATITPLSTSSKVLVLAYHGGVCKESGNAGSSCAIYVYRGATRLFVDQTNGYNNTSSIHITNWSASYLDSPNTTSATTYKTTFSNMVNTTGVSIGRSIGVGFQYAYIQLVEIAG